MKCLFRIADYEVYRFSMPVIFSNMYLVPVGDCCLVVDPMISRQAERLLKERRIENCTILLTHEHFDHISGVNRLRELLPCQVICSQVCAERIVDPRKNAAAYFEAMFLGREKAVRKWIDQEVDPNYSCQADQTYTDQMDMRWMDFTIRLRETPGHSPGSQVFEIGGHWYFTGDSWIPGQEIITRLPGGSKNSYEAVTCPYLERIAPGSIVYPGHGEESLYYYDSSREDNK